ncbi:MAG TPA: hypothetical protein VJN21_09970 [Candidatus Acidoferrales bacterium]|nr:hypothetical protein [Candidatus Acidoferrales bacterium]
MPAATVYIEIRCAQGPKMQEIEERDGWRDDLIATKATARDAEHPAP